MINNKPRIIKNLIFIVLILLLIAYALYNSRIFIAGPQIEIISPENGATVENSPLIRVEGTAENIAFINLNDRPINTDANSYFNEPVLLYPGYNIIKVHARDKFDRTIEKQIEIIYQGDEDEFEIESDDGTVNEMMDEAMNEPMIESTDNQIDETDESMNNSTSSLEEF